MLYVDFYREYISDLRDVKMFVSKEDDSIMKADEFIGSLTLYNNENVYNLNAHNEHEAFFMDEIQMQWYVFIDSSRWDLLKDFRHPFE